MPRIADCPKFTSWCQWRDFYLADGYDEPEADQLADQRLLEQDNRERLKEAGWPAR